MRRKSSLEFDEIGYWSEMKLHIVKEFARAYSTILSAQHRRGFSHVYIDGFAGGGMHRSRRTGSLVAGSPLNALQVQPPFDEYYFIDLDRQKVKALREIAAERANVHVYEGDCNQILSEKVFPLVRYEDRRRGLCLLDPYGLHLSWQVIQTAGQLGTIDLFLNFPVMDINRNALWRTPERVRRPAIARMNSFWGDDSWRRIAYRKTPGLFEDFEEKADNETVATAFRERLVEVAGFQRVPRPLPMRNSAGADVYYLFFASQKEVAEKIAKAVFKKYQEREVS